MEYSGLTMTGESWIQGQQEEDLLSSSWGSFSLSLGYLQSYKGHRHMLQEMVFIICLKTYGRHSYLQLIIPWKTNGYLPIKTHWKGHLLNRTKYLE